MVAPHGLGEIRTVYGEVKVDKQGGAWRIIYPTGWEAANMVLLRDLPGLPGRKLYVHRVIIQPLQAALEAWQRTCPEYAIKTLGCFAPRPKRTSASTFGVVGWDKGLSLHTVGAAVDVNAATNPMGAELVTDMPEAFVACWESNGWRWGGHFPRPDAMHFQFATGY